MAEPIGIASGLAALATFALTSSISLYQAVDSFQSNKRIIRELKEELEALDCVLKSLQQAAIDNGTDLTSLNLPLFRCGKACKEFEAVIIKCTAHSGGSRTSFRDWAKLTYMGGDIAGFKSMLGGYKSTISIALGDANFRKAAVTTNVVKEYKEMITNTTSDLEDHLQEIDKRLQTLHLQGARVSDEDAAEREQILEERDSTKQCLTICAQVSEHLDRVRPTVFEDISAAPDSHQKIVTPLRGLIPSKQVTTKVLRECKEKLIDTTFKLEEHLHKIDNRLANHSLRGGRISDEVEAERERVQQERDSVTQCLSICAKASEQVDKVQTNVFEDVSAAEEAHQLIVATLGDLISATRVSAGVRAVQWLGQMSDDTVQQLSRDRGMANRASRERALEQESGMLSKFEDQYGAGYRLQWGAVVPTSSV